MTSINQSINHSGQTPERIEFENIDAMSDGEPSVDQVIDENEWTDRNFGTGTEESDTDFSSSDESESSNSDIYEEALGSPLGAQTLQLATDWIGKQRYNSNQYTDDDDSYATSEGKFILFELEFQRYKTIIFICCRRRRGKPNGG